MQRFRNRKKVVIAWLRTHKLLASYFLAWAAYFTFFWSKALFIDANGNFVAGHINIWGDWAAHLTMTTAIAERGLFIQSPFLLGAKFQYPFAMNAISALLLKLQLPLIPAMVVPSLVASIALIIVLFIWYRSLFSSQRIAVIASLLFLLNGGVGFWWYAHDVLHSVNPIETVLSPPRQYTRIDGQGIKWINVIDSMVIPQRAFALGFPVAVGLLTISYTHLFVPKKPSIQLTKVLLTGLALGALPIMHAHSFLAVAIILACWSSEDFFQSVRERRITQKTKRWLLLGSSASVTAVPLFLVLFTENTHTIKFQPGWLAPEFATTWLIFWLRNWGVVPIAAMVGYLIWLRHPSPELRKRLLLFLPFPLLFTLANLFLFQPFMWDNTKLIVWASLGFSSLMAYVLNHAWSHFKKPLVKILLVIIFVGSIASGTLDAYWILRHDLHSYIMYSSEELQLAEWVKENTPRDSIWITDTNHNNWLFNLTGRQAIMTYPGWLWTHGYEYRHVETAIARRDVTIWNQAEYVTFEKNSTTMQLPPLPYETAHSTQNYVIYKLEEK